MRTTPGSMSGRSGLTAFSASTALARAWRWSAARSPSAWARHHKPEGAADHDGYKGEQRQRCDDADNCRLVRHSLQMRARNPCSGHLRPPFWPRPTRYSKARELNLERAWLTPDGEG